MFLKDSICKLQVIHFNIYIQDKRIDLGREENFVGWLHNVNNPKGWTHGRTIWEE